MDNDRSTMVDRLIPYTQYFFYFFGKSGNNKLLASQMKTPAHGQLNFILDLLCLFLYTHYRKPFLLHDACTIYFTVDESMFSIYKGLQYAQTGRHKTERGENGNTRLRIGSIHLLHKQSKTLSAASHVVGQN